MTANWNEIPSIDDLAIDWDYEPDNPLGKRSTLRLNQNQLLRILGDESVPVKILPIVSVKIMSRKAYKRGYLFDISADGFAAIIHDSMEIGTLVKVGFFLGKRKIVSKGIVRNISSLAENYRVGIEFVQLGEETVSFILSLSSSAVYKL